MTDNCIVSNQIDKEYLSQLNRNYFNWYTHECTKIPSTNTTFAYITGTFIHFPRKTIQHLLEFHLGWFVKRTLHGCNVCVIGSLIHSEILKRILAYDVKIYTEVEILKLVTNPCQDVNDGKFLKYINGNSSDFTKVPNQKPVYYKLWHKASMPINLYDIAGHQDELIEFHDFIKHKKLVDPIIIIYPAGVGVYRAIELCLLTLNYEMVLRDALEIKSTSKSKSFYSTKSDPGRGYELEFKRQRSSKFTEIPTYKVEKLTEAHLQTLSRMREFAIIFVSNKYKLIAAAKGDKSIHSIELQMPAWIDKVKCKKFIFYPPPEQAVAYRIGDVLQQMNHSVDIGDVNLLIDYCKTDGIIDVECVLSRLMFILALDINSGEIEQSDATSPLSEDPNFHNTSCTKWYVDNHLKDSIGETYNDSEILQDTSALYDKFESLWQDLYNRECNISGFADKITVILQFYDALTQTLSCGHCSGVYVDNRMSTLICCTTLSKPNPYF